MTIEREVYTPATAAPVVGVHPNTIRLWAKEYGPALSDGAQTKPLKFSPADVATFQAIKDLRSAGVESTDILQRLAQVPKEELQHPYIDTPENNAQEAPDDDTRSNTSTDTAIAQHSPTSTVSLPVNVTELIVSRLDNVSDRLSTLEARKTAVQWFALGAVAGGALIVAGLLLAWLLLR